MHMPFLSDRRTLTKDCLQSMVIKHSVVAGRKHSLLPKLVSFRRAEEQTCTPQYGSVNKAGSERGKQCIAPSSCMPGCESCFIHLARVCSVSVIAWRCFVAAR